MSFKEESAYSEEKVIQNTKFQYVKEFFSNNFIFLVLFLGCIFLAFAFDATIVTNTSGAAIIALLMIFVYACYLYVKKQLTIERLIALIFIAGFILRLQYVLSTPITVRQHDVGEFGSGDGWEGGTGHAGYIEWFFFNKFSLIDENPMNMGIFYHPPFHYFVSALWMHILTHFGSWFGMTYARAAASVQYLTLFYSSCCMIVAERIFRKLGLKKKGLVLACSLIAFHPTFILLSGSINNDILSILLIFLAIYCTICWYQRPSYLNIIGIALSVGLGMMTKLSVAIIAIPIAVVFLVKFISERVDWRRYIKQFFVFGIICVPLGLGYSIRNLIKYGVPITYVQRVSETSAQYIGQYSIFERLFDFSNHPLSNVFINMGNEGSYEYNPFIAILKSPCFGEYDFSTVNENIVPFCWALLILNACLMIIAVCATVYYLLRKNDYLTRTMKAFIGGYYLLIMINYFNFCFEYPHTCSMDFRYIVPTVLVGALFIGILAESNENDNGGTIASTIIYRLVTVLVVLFALSSTVVYLMIGMTI